MRWATRHPPRRAIPPPRARWAPARPPPPPPRGARGGSRPLPRGRHRARAQLSSLLARLATLFPDPDQCVVVVAEQSADGRKFNRGQLLNVAFAHLRASRPEWISGDTLYCFHDCDMLPAPSLAHHYLRPRPLLPESERTPLGPFVRVLTAAGSRYDHDACFGGVTLYDAPRVSRHKRISQRLLGLGRRG